MPKLRDGQLSQKQESFVLNYFQSGKHTESAILAGYSPKTAAVIASENLTKPTIQFRLQQLRDKAQSAKIADVVERKERLTEIIRARLTDYQTSDGILVDNTSPNTGAIESLEVAARTSKDSQASEITIKRPVVPEALRNEIFEQDGNKCRLCSSTINLQIDHIIPLSKGGRTVRDNLQALCEKCNKRKGSGKKSQREIITKLKLHSPLQAIDILNKMDKIYSEIPAGYQDNSRVINIIVGEKTKKLIEGLNSRLIPEKTDS